MFREGQNIGPYTLVRKLGRGGFGEVWLGERRGKFVTTKVAVKLPLDEDVDRSTIQQEAALWERASGHPNVLPIIDADEYDGQVVIVSEFAPDGSLHDWLKVNGRMPIEECVELTIQILAGLEFLHSRDIIHRDLKPHNILLQGGTPRLADFGISRALRSTASSQTQNVSGTFAYMPPEGFDGKRSVQTDVWAAGVNSYLLLSGRLPFPASEPSVLIASIMMKDHDPLPAEVPEALRNIVNKALAKDTAERYTSAAEMAGDLRHYRKSHSTGSFQVRSVETISAEVNTPETETVVRPAETAHGVRIPIITADRSEQERIGKEPVLEALSVFDETEEVGSSNILKYSTEAVLIALVIIAGLIMLFGGDSSTETKGNERTVSNAGSNNTASRNAPSPTPQPTSSPRTAGVSPTREREQNDGATAPGEDRSRETTGQAAAKTVSGGLLNDKAVSLPRPNYPAAARAMRQSGVATVRVVVNESGQVTSAALVDAPPLLGAAAVEAARAARFNPTIVNGRPVKVSGTLRYNFVIN